MSEVIFETRKCFLWFPIRFTKYQVVKSYDDYELIIHKGLISRSEEKIKLFKINDVGYNRSLGNFLFGVGNLTISSSDSSARRTSITKIRNYKDFGKKLEDLIYSERKRMNVIYSENNIIR